MSIGRTVRRLLGRHEQRVADMYRDAFLDTTSLAESVAAYADGPRVLEVGCGDGFVADALVRRLAGAHVTGIDIAATPGRLYSGDPDRADFRSCTVESFAAGSPEPFDLVLVVDVLHHVDDTILPSLVATAASLVRPGGHLVVKEWERNRSVGYRVGWFSDRVISGERVRFFDRDGLVDEIERHTVGFERVGEARVRPRRSNLIVAWRRTLDEPGRRLETASTTATSTTTTAGDSPADHGSTR